MESLRPTLAFGFGVLLGLGVLLGGALPVRAQAHAPTLRLGELLALAEARNPSLSALRFAADAAAYREPAASALPDPVIQLGVMNFGVPDFNTDMAMSMAPAIQLSQTLPWPGKLSRAEEIARFDSDIALATVSERTWMVRARVAALFYDLYSLDRRTEVMRETLGLLESFQQVALAMYGAGTGRQADVLRADVEVARMSGEIRRLEAQRIGRAARLNAIIDAPANQFVAEPVLGALPLEVPDQTTLGAWAREARPALLGAELGVRQAGVRTGLAARQIWPDVMVGLSYGQRDRGAGTERMASLMLGASLPLHAGSRQYALRDEAAAREGLAEARLDGLEAEVNARIGELLAELETARVLVDLYRDEVVPEARANVESAFSSYRVGSVDFMTLVDAQMTTNRYEAELHVLLASYGTAIAALESAVGRPLPRTGPTLSETR